jgi:hypothetical protein
MISMGKDKHGKRKRKYGAYAPNPLTPHSPRVQRWHNSEIYFFPIFTQLGHDTISCVAYPAGVLVWWGVMSSYAGIMQGSKGIHDTARDDAGNHIMAVSSAFSTVCVTFRDVNVQIPIPTRWKSPDHDLPSRTRYQGWLPQLSLKCRQK